MDDVVMTIPLALLDGLLVMTVSVVPLKNLACCSFTTFITLTSSFGNRKIRS